MKNLAPFVSLGHRIPGPIKERMQIWEKRKWAAWFAAVRRSRAFCRFALVVTLAAGPAATAQDTTPPEISAVVPEIGATVRSVEWVSVVFTEEVVGVGAEDLLLDGTPAEGVTGSGRGPYIFSFASVSGRIATISWALGHGITDRANPPNPFTAVSWAYRVDPERPPSRVVLSEFLADNPGGLEDADGDSPDWVEISNDGDDWVNLEAWALTDDLEDRGKWPFPPLLLGPRSYLVVFASGKDRRPEGGGELHTNFQLDLDGEYLALTLPPGDGPGAFRQIATDFPPAYPPQRSGYSFGFDDSGVPVHFPTPTPGDANGQGYDGFVDDTKFSVDRGFFRGAFDVAITTRTREAQIRYTVDGTRPTETTGTVYSGPVRVDGTTTLRAAAFKPGLIPSNVDTQTYIFLDEVLRQTGTGFPATWGPVAADYRMDPDVVNHPSYRDTIRDDLLSVPSVSIVMDTADLFGPAGIYSNPTARGSAWERPASMEWIRPDGREGFQTDAGIQIFGGASRTPTNTGKHSLRLLFRGIYGAAKLEQRLFEDSSVDEFDTVMLRGGYNYKWTHNSSTQQQRAQYGRDEFARQTLNGLGQPSSHGRYVHLYLNGLYWGMFNLAERPDASFAAAYLGGDKDDYDVIKADEPPYAISGDKEFWSEMMILANAGLQGTAAYGRIRDYLDVDSLIDYTILNHFIGNVDGPVCICGTDRPRNFYAARLRAAGGKYHFFAWDSEHSLAETSVDRTELGVADADDTPARLYARLRENPEFRLRFADHVHRHFFNGGALTVDRNVARWLDNASRMDRAVVGESARWGDYRRSTPYTRDAEWFTEQGRLVSSYFPVRSSIVLNQYRADGLYPRLAAPTFNQHGGLVPEGFRVVLAAPEGTIYFTSDGSDPRLAGGGLSPTAGVYEGGPTTTLVAARADCRALVPANGDLGLDWTASDFGHSGWKAGSTGVGFERGSGYEDLIATDVEDEMYGTSGTVYVRIPFEVDAHPALDTLTLRMKYDDGFVAYINGLKVAARNAPAAPAWDSIASGSNSDSVAIVFEDFNASSALAVLRAGTNVLAIHGLNASAASSDMLILPELIGTEATAATVPLSSWAVSVKSRARSGQEWSALSEATFVLDVPLDLRVTEIMYHPSALPAGTGFEAKEFEFIELRNVGAASLELAGIQITGGIEFDFGAGEIAALGPGEYLVVVKNDAAFRTLYDAKEIQIAGEYRGSLSNGGERIVVEDLLERTILDFEYDDSWYRSTDGGGYSLHVRDAYALPDSWSDPASWRASHAIHGSPGKDDTDLSDAGGQIPGDFNQDGGRDVSDAVTLLISLFLGGPGSLPCTGETMGEGSNLLVFDLNGDGGVDITDPISLLSYLFTGGVPPALGTECVTLEGCAQVCTP